MSTTANKKWESVKKNIKAALEAVPFNMWFSDLKFFKYDKDSASLYLVTSENELIKTQLETRFKKIIINESKELFGEVSNVNILLPHEVTETKRNKNLQIRSKSINSEAERFMNPRFTFDTFIVGDNSRFAYSCALAVAENAEDPNRTYNPLFIYGGAGLGKTHLMCAIGHYIYDQNPNLKVRYVSSEMFTNDYVNSTMAPANLRNERMQEFKEKYRNIDVLMIDDIQFIESKEKTIEEVFWTYSELYESDKQLIFSSDKPPKELLGVDDRLKSRLSSGIIVDIQPPAFEVKVAILKNKALLDNIPITDGLMEVIELIASKIKNNIREMEGAFNRIIAFSTFSGKPINKQMAPQVLHDVLSSADAMPTAKNIKKHVAKYYEISVSDIESTKKARSFSYPRQIAMYLCREMTDLSLDNIGKAFGSRDHTTVIYAYDKIKEQKINDGNLNSVLKTLEETIRNN